MGNLFGGQQFGRRGTAIFLGQHGSRATTVPEALASLLSDAKDLTIRLVLFAGESFVGARSVDEQTVEFAGLEGTMDQMERFDGYVLVYLVRERVEVDDWLVAGVGRDDGSTERHVKCRTCSR